MSGNLEKVKAFVEAHPERLNEVTFQPQKGRRRTLKELTFCWMLSVGKWLIRHPLVLFQRDREAIKKKKKEKRGTHQSGDAFSM